MAKFTAKERFKGFDPKKRWQMIPLNSARSILLEDGANMKMTLKDTETMKELNSEMAILQEISAPNQITREFYIWGLQTGKVLLHAEDSNKEAKLYIRILPLVITNLDFYFLCDQKNKTKTTSSELPTLVSETNFFLFSQTNVWLSTKSIYELSVNYDFGQVIDADELIAELKKRFSWDGTYPSVIFVWQFNKKGKEYGGDTIGFTKPPFIIQEDPKNDMERTFRAKILAHEVGHYFLGPTHYINEESYENLMYLDFILFGAELNRGQINKFNRNKVAWW